MSDNKKSGRGIYGKGYYIALVLCAAAIGISGYLYYRNANETQPVLQEPEIQPTLSVAVVEDDFPAGALLPGKTDPTQGTEQQKGALKTMLPVSGQTVAEYAMETLSYNETTRDWRVHNGIDIAAEEGAEVCAAAEGTVIAVREDDAMGCTVVIRHDGGYVTEYASLREDLAVQEGDTVVLGQTIGYAGSTALVETTLGSHVHFSVTHQNLPMDPAEFLALGE